MGTALSRLGGGIGTRGPGESKLETDKRHIRKRINILEEELKHLEERRIRQRSRRKKDSVLTAAIVGYTNAGKSTLLNALTSAGVLAENKLFATLDTTSRSIDLPDGRSVLLVDDRSSECARIHNQRRASWAFGIQYFLIQKLV